MCRWFGQRLARIDYVRRAIADKADLSAFAGRPRAAAAVGLVLMALSYLIGWPAVLLFAVLAAALDMPLLLAIGGPAIYGFSYVVFFVGLYLVGRKYSNAFMRWAARRTVLWLLGESPRGEGSA